MRGHAKITPSHLARTALVYVRQSTLAQVRNNTESTARQYGLADQAARLGWAGSAIEVIDADLGLSGRSAQGRAGFKEVVGRVCLGEVGAIFGLEVSRLARSSADLSKLLELARLTDTLVIDGDGVYDLSDFNDRMLLGLKSTMSEAELHILASRMDQAKRAAAARGELRLALPAGFVHDDEGAVVIDPDQEVQAAVADLFALFRATGSAYGVVGAFTGRRFPRRAHGGSWTGELAWAPLTHDRVLKVLANPVYAGAYVFGRHRLQRVVTPDGSVVTRRVDQPRAQWETLLLGHHAGYISWEEFGANQARVAANRTNLGARPPREGPALCQGMVHCGACGRSMGVRYSHGQPSYECGRSRADHVATPACRSARAATVDHAVAGQLLAALSGEEVALALAAADEVTRRRASTTRAAELAVERARYQAGRAERALLACEPENRLVARTFETRLEARLRELAEAEAALATARTTTAPLPPRAELEAAVADLDQLWAAPTTADRDRKRLLRTLLADVTLTPDTDPAKLRIGLRWRSGSAEELVVQRSNRVQEARRTNPEAVELVRQLGPLTDNATLASKLTTAGLVTGAGRTFDAAAVGAVRRSYGIASPGLLAPGEATVSDVASRLAVAHSTVIAWIQTGLLTARRGPTNRYLIAFGAQAEAACRARIAAFPWLHAQANTDPPGPHERTPSQIAEQLGISRDAVYNWIQRGYLPARHGPGRHLYVPFTPQVQTACRQRIIDSPQLPAATKTQALQSPTGAAL